MDKKAAAKEVGVQELANQALGWGLYVGGIAGTKKGRASVVSGVQKGAEVANKVLTLARKALGVI
jgi:NAD(P)H-nitrite reductase large subunit